MTIASYRTLELHLHAKVRVERSVEGARLIVIGSEIRLVRIAQKGLHVRSGVVGVADGRRRWSADEVGVQARLIAPKVRERRLLTPKTRLQQVRERHRQAHARRQLVTDLEVAEQLRRLAERADCVELAREWIGYRERCRAERAAWAHPVRVERASAGGAVGIPRVALGRSRQRRPAAGGRIDTERRERRAVAVAGDELQRGSDR